MTQAKALSQIQVDIWAAALCLYYDQAWLMWVLLAVVALGYVTEPE